MAGDEVIVVDPRGTVLGRGLYTPRSAIPVRMFTRADTPVDGQLIRRRIDAAIAHRRELGLPSSLPGNETTAYRLVHAEGDGLPSLTVDVFGDVIAVQFSTIGIKQREGIVLDALTGALCPRAILDRTPDSAARMEGFVAAAGVVRGDRSVQALSFVERGLRYEIPLSRLRKRPAFTSINVHFELASSSSRTVVACWMRSPFRGCVFDGSGSGRRCGSLPWMRVLPLSRLAASAHE